MPEFKVGDRVFCDPTLEAVQGWEDDNRNGGLLGVVGVITEVYNYGVHIVYPHILPRWGLDCCTTYFDTISHAPSEHPLTKVFA